MTDSPLLTAREAAAILGVCRAFMTAHAAELGGRKVGALLKFRREDIDAYLDRQQITELVAADPAPPTRISAARTYGRGPINPATKRPWGQPLTPAGSAR
jgi:hypothetical protein